MNIGQSYVPTTKAVSQFRVIDAEKVQHVRMEVMNGQFVLHDTVAVFVSGPIDRATFNASSGHP